MAGLVNKSYDLPIYWYGGNLRDDRKYIPSKYMPNKHIHYIYIYIPPKPSHSCFLLLVNYQFDPESNLKMFSGFTHLPTTSLCSFTSILPMTPPVISPNQAGALSCDRVASESRGHQRCDPLPNQRPSLPARTPMAYTAKWRNGEGMACLPAGDPEANFCRPWRIILNKYHQISDIITGWWLTTCFNYLENMSKSMGRMTSRIWNGK